MKRFLKITALILALVLTAAVVWFAAGLLGNPVSAALSRRTAHRHLEQNYSDTDFYIESVAYDFKSAGYYAKVASRSSRDSYFTLRMSMNGELRSDNYETMVLGRHNTHARLWNAYRASVKDILEVAQLPYPVEMCGGSLEIYPRAEHGESYVPDHAMAMEELELDKEYDLRELGSRIGHVSVYLNADEITPQVAAEGLLSVRDALDQAGIRFYTIDLVLRQPKPEDGSKWDLENSIDVKDFLYANIQQEGLAERIREADQATKAYYAQMDKEKQAEIEAAQNAE